MATTFKAIREHFCGSSTARGLIEALTPTLIADAPFTRSQRRVPLRDWADGDSTCLRHFEWVSDSDVETIGAHGQDVRMVREFATLTVAYPTMPALAGADEMDALEDLIRSDAAQIFDCLFSPANLFADLYAVMPTILAPERGDDVTFQSFRVELQYREAMTLTG
jgi:hypothetical protein